MKRGTYRIAALELQAHLQALGYIEAFGSKFEVRIMFLKVVSSSPPSSVVASREYFIVDKTIRTALNDVEISTVQSNGITTA